MRSPEMWLSDPSPLPATVQSSGLGETGEVSRLIFVSGARLTFMSLIQLSGRKFATPPRDILVEIGPIVKTIFRPRDGFSCPGALLRSGDHRRR